MDAFRYVRQKVSNVLSPPAIKYHGLVNQGSTCYLNSVLQVLFMTKDFREAVERFPSEKTEHIDLQLQSLFGDLKSRTAKTKDITKKLGIQYVHKEQDAAEYYEKILRLTSDDASKIFHGQLTHMTTCSSCDTKTGADGALWHLPLALEDSSSQNYSVEKGIEEFFRASHFNGENQMYCDECRAKSDATTKCVIKHNPEVLTLLLKRFQLDHYSKRYVKINCTVDVPCTLQIPENQPYELYAMVEHFGDLRGGHYIAKIKSEHDGRWHSFNDSCVTELHSQPLQSDIFEKSSSAYLLFYRKEKVPAAGTQDFREESSPGGFPLSICETQDQSPAERREGEEDEGTAEEGKDAAATAFINRDKGTGIKDKDRGKSRKSGLSPDISNVEDQGNRGSARPRNDSNEESNEEDMRGNAGIRTSRDTSSEESVSNMRSPPAIKKSGYIATIKPEDDGRWYSFNDRCVTLANDQPLQLGQVEKSDRKKKDTQDTRGKPRRQETKKEKEGLIQRSDSKKKKHNGDQKRSDKRNIIETGEGTSPLKQNGSEKKKNTSLWCPPFCKGRGNAGQSD